MAPLVPLAPRGALTWDSDLVRAGFESPFLGLESKLREEIEKADYDLISRRSFGVADAGRFAFHTVSKGVIDQVSIYGEGIEFGRADAPGRQATVETVQAIMGPDVNVIGRD